MVAVAAAVDEQAARDGFGVAGLAYWIVAPVETQPAVVVPRTAQVPAVAVVLAGPRTQAAADARAVVAVAVAAAEVDAAVAVVAVVAAAVGAAADAAADTAAATSAPSHLHLPHPSSTPAQDSSTTPSPTPSH